MSTQKITNGNTSLLAAVKSNSDLKTLEYLISQEADVNAKDKNGKIPQDFANTNAVINSTTISHFVLNRSYIFVAIVQYVFSEHKESWK
jgi:hypothetical protein